DWEPWWDCDPDITFRVTQNCRGQDAVLVDEGFWQTRWDIPTVLDVTLVANENACCVPPRQGCQEGDCLLLTEACDDLVKDIGGTAGPAPLRAGYLTPGLVAINGDQPYAGDIPISGTAECMAGVDYYEFEWSSDGGITWNDMPVSAAGSFARVYYDFIAATW